ncbi:SDR family oxidoreductase [Mucilaginibacter sp. BJC16-A38]|uniref:SDR family NAD(P)-dependent oxidoreductase n=1 Tax=Mucilaginibacter phenanthrenivorans TaxID=1234842 RepID=UPI0021586E07|nr:SDR family oxidoreductase [Mucilaginibacter phenanthrenivorans]MCR8560081.1 SDR family oxidoreductase [Mucilaginibacter phenanthrenivorans]
MTDKNFSGQVAIITGAGQGIGFEIARQLAFNGVSVILNDIDQDLAAEAAAAIEKQNGICFAMAGDASDVDFIQHLVDEAVAKFGKLTIAIANAGITTFGKFLDYRPESLQKIMNLNLYGSFFLTQKAALQMKKQGDGGSILLMSSVTGHQAHENLTAYGMTKAGLNMLAKSLVIELSPFNVNINTIAPGATLTERTLMDVEYLETWSRITPMGKPATVEDIANAALFFVSPASRHITGQSLVIDGGWTAMSPSPY